MATISGTNLQTIADNIAKTLTDIQTAFITNPGTATPTIATITAGQNAASASLYAHVLGLNDLQQESDLAASAKAAADAVVSSLTVSMNTYYALYGKFFVALDKHVGGLNAFLAAGSLQVQTMFANAFNYIANNAAALGLSNQNMTPIASAQINAGRAIAY